MAKFRILLFAVFLTAGFEGAWLFAGEEKSWFDEDRWKSIVQDGKKDSERLYDVNRDYREEGESASRVDRLIKETSTGDEENVPVVTFQKLLKPQISEDRDAKAPYEAISIDAEKEPDGPEKEKPDNEDDKKKQIIIEEPDARVRTEPIGITRAREMIDELDSEKARRLRILQSPIGRKTDLPGAPKMPPPGGKSTR